jgi:hypothetical protein
MEYLLIVGLTFIVSWFIIKISNKKRGKFLSKIRYRQSNIYEMVKDVIPKEMFEKPKVITQSQKHVQKNMLKVVITEGKAYWILDNVFYTANAINGRVDESTVEPLDIQNLSKKDLSKMLSILDDLRKGMESNDSGSSGNNGV